VSDEAEQQALPHWLWLANFDVTCRAIKAFTSRSKLSEEFSDNGTDFSCARDPAVSTKTL